MKHSQVVSFVFCLMLAGGMLSSGILAQEDGQAEVKKEMTKNDYDTYWTGKGNTLSKPTPQEIENYNLTGEDVERLTQEVVSTLEEKAAEYL